MNETIVTFNTLSYDLLASCSFTFICISFAFALYVLCNPTNYSTSKFLFILYLAVISLDISAFIYIKYENYLGVGVHFNSFRNTSTLLKWPILFLFTKSLIFKDFKLSLRYLWHILPLLLMLGWYRISFWNVAGLSDADLSYYYTTITIAV